MASARTGVLSTRLGRWPCTLALAVLTLPALAGCSGGATVMGAPVDPMDSATEPPDAPEATAVDAQPTVTQLPEQAENTEPPDTSEQTQASSESESEPVAEPEPEPTFIAPRGACQLGERVGRFSIEEQVDFGVIQGTVADGVVPATIPALIGQSGSCQLLERRTLVCLPACVGAETCGESGTCIPYPRQVSVGDVTISGLTPATSMSPLSPGNSYFAPGADNPPYEVASEIVLSAPGAGMVPAFQLFGMGSEAFTEAPSWVLEAGAALSLEWAAPTSTVETSVLVELTIDQHGTSPLSLSCELEDTGSAAIPASIIDHLIGSGVSGFPNGRITRRTADHVQLEAGCVELVVGSPLAVSVAVAGYTPCNGPEDCPDEQTCNLPLERCE